MKKTRIIIFALLAILITIPIAAKAFAVKTSDSIFIGRDEVVDGNLYAAGKNITIEGVVTGDVIAVGQQITIDGRVDGDVITASTNLRINGQVKGNVRVAANDVTINGQVEKNINIAAVSAVLGSDSITGSDVLIMAESLEARGNILGSLHGILKRLLLSGIVNKDLKFKFNSNSKLPVTLTDSAQVQGDFIYSHNKDLNINQQTVAGEVKYEKTDTKKAWGSILWNLLLGIFSALIVGLLLVTLMKSHLKDLHQKMEEKPGRSILWGLGILVIVPILCFLLMLTIIGIPLALIILAIWLIMVYVAKILTAIYFGNILRKKALKAKKFNPMTDMILGIVVAWLLFMIPVIGPLLVFLAIIFGLGSFWFFRKDLHHKLNK